MSCTDRDIAITLLFLDEAEKNYMFSLFSQAKIRRIKEESELLKKSRIADNMKKAVLQKIIETLEHGKSGKNTVSYLKPHGK